MDTDTVNTKGEVENSKVGRVGKLISGGGAFLSTCLEGGIVVIQTVTRPGFPSRAVITPQVTFM